MGHELMHRSYHLDSKQRGVAHRMAAAFLTAVAIFVLAAIFGGPRIAANSSVEFRLGLLAASLIAPAAALFICIARLAKHRFFTPEDIDGSALTEGTSRAMLLQALLQNTLEQLALAVPVYLSCSFLFPDYFLGLVPAAAAMFFVARSVLSWLFRWSAFKGVWFRLHFLPDSHHGMHGRLLSRNQWRRLTQTLATNRVPHFKETVRKSDEPTMRKNILAALPILAAVLLQISPAWTAETAGGPVDLSALTWTVQPNGVSIAVFLGNPKEAGPYGVRAKLPPNWRIAPHTHPEEGRVNTVISGTFYWAKGDTFDESKLQAFGPGSVIIEAKGVPHFAMTKEEGAVLQVTAVGPAGLEFLSKDQK